MSIQIIKNEPFIISYSIANDIATSILLTGLSKESVEKTAKKEIMKQLGLKDYADIIILNVRSFDELGKQAGLDLAVIDIQYTADSISDCIDDTYERIVDCHEDGIAQPQQFDINDGWCATVMDELLDQGIELRIAQRVWENAVNRKKSENEQANK
ncbi:hypothetical protein C9J21_20670 [Photobacterium phosphoreum]|uniref:hypothetical protein n=1 Tax=Photobacterium phosphoreum TaxID=659 RepID=UPI000D1549B3|nr:hypothetical protein [Photobacterium phosphoreum]PSW28410.1 hypothetical protein C9J21_20670 [Photobacterium phosphoreum]